MNTQELVLSIGMIFKDDIRCIERCLKCLQPLRNAIPCELVMADTGSTDGSREVAEKYADILFDFPWINDFAAARNAVMDRCTGKWFLSVDTDEYLQTGIDTLRSYLADLDILEDFGTVIVRNHTTYEMDGDYNDFMALRIARMSNNPRFVGSIHETLTSANQQPQIRAFPQVIFDHDGYVGMDTTEAGKAKRQRNLKLLRQRITEVPNDLAIQLEMLDSAVEEPDFPELVRNAVAVVKKKPAGWEGMGPSVMRNAIFAADVKGLPERDEWIELAESWFPDSLFTRVDVQFAKQIVAFREDDYEKCVQWGEAYLKGMADYHARIQIAELMHGILSQSGPMQEQRGKIVLANACCNTGRLERAAELLTGLDYARLDQVLVGQMMTTLQELQYKSMTDTSSLIMELWEGISQEKPNKEKTAQQMNMFFQVAGTAFAPENQENEREKQNFCRPSYTLYLPLRGKCEVGAAAAILKESAPAKIEAILTEVDDWTRFPIHALAYALEQGVRFPLPGKPLNLETMDALTARLAVDRERFLPIVKEAVRNGDMRDGQGLAWLRGLVLASVQSFPWTNSKNAEETAEEKQKRTEDGLDLARMLAQVEKEFLPRCYAADVLTESGLFFLPPMHRFGFYCAQAFDALDAGDGAGYVRLLRAGLSVSEGVKDMVEFLLDHTPELQEKPEPSAELKALADQVRAVLANFSPDDPAVVALKQSEAYQKVAYLIEGIDVPVVGGLLQ